MSGWLAALGGTKNILCWGILLISTALIGFGKISMDVWATVVISVAGGYIVGNVSATLANGYTAKAEKK